MYIKFQLFQETSNSFLMWDHRVEGTHKYYDVNKQLLLTMVADLKYPECNTI